MIVIERLEVSFGFFRIYPSSLECKSRALKYIFISEDSKRTEKLAEQEQHDNSPAASLPLYNNPGFNIQYPILPGR